MKNKWFWLTIAYLCLCLGILCMVFFMIELKKIYDGVFVQQTIYNVVILLTDCVVFNIIYLTIKDRK